MNGWNLIPITQSLDLPCLNIYRILALIFPPVQRDTECSLPNSQNYDYRPRGEGDNVLGSVRLSGCTQGTLYTTTPVYGLLVLQEGAICTTQAQYAPRCTRETMFFVKFRGPGWFFFLVVDWNHTQNLYVWKVSVWVTLNGSHCYNYF